MMMTSVIRFLICSVLLVGAACAPAVTPGTAPADSRPDLQQTLEELVVGFRGEVGIHVLHLASGEEAAVAADDTFPTASVIKVPLLAVLFERIEAGDLSLDDEMTWHDSLAYPGRDITAQLREGETISLERLAFLMTSWSDNTASLWIQALVGGGQAVNRWLATNGFATTRVNSRTPGREADWEVYGWGQTTPREMSRLMTMIREQRAVSHEASERMYRLLSAPFYSAEALSVLPPTVQVAVKPGAVRRSRSETLVVEPPGGPYVLTVVTKNQEDDSYDHDNEGWALIRAVSLAVWEHFVTSP